MGAFEELTAAVQAQSEQLAALTAELAELRRLVKPTRETYSLRDLAELPESPSLKTLRNRPELQPNRGQPDGFRGAQKAWRRSSVEAWRRELSPGPDAPRIVRQEAS